MWSLTIPGASQESFDRHGQALARIESRLSGDPALLGRAEQDATALFAAEGIAVPAGMQVRLYRDTDAVLHLVMPPAPNRMLSDEHLETIAGGVGTAATVSTSATNCVTSGYCASPQGCW